MRRIGRGFRKESPQCLNQASISASGIINKHDLDYRTPELPDDSRSASPAPQDQPQRRSPGLRLLQQADGNPNLPYDEYYSIEWKLLKKRRLSKLTNDTEQILECFGGQLLDPDQSTTSPIALTRNASLD